MTSVKILVAGGTGLVGTELLKLLAQRSNVHVTALVRQIPALGFSSDQIVFRVFDYDREEDFQKLAQEKFDAVFCCLGTTRKKAGSDKEFAKVDFEYPRRLLAAVAPSYPIFCAVSSVGADKPRGLYLSTKAAMEKTIMSSGLRYVILRPSLLLGQRQEFRFGEWIAGSLFSRLRPVLENFSEQKIAEFMPIYASEVARAMVTYALDRPPQEGGVVIFGRALFWDDEPT
jgi:uncharacterized protein YbjT (DUF2867 family)